jgi:3-oxoacyl-(acyl-carrier-protein) synthase
MARDREVVVTAWSATSAFGAGADALASGIATGAPAFTELEGTLALAPPGRGGVLDLPSKDYRNWFDTRVLRLSTMTRQTTLGCVACGDLMRRAGIAEGGEHPDKGAYLGSFIVPPDFKKQAVAMRLLSHRPEGADRGHVLDDARLDQAMKKASAFDFLRALPNMPSSHLSIQTGFQGPACTYLGSDASGMQAVVMAAGAVRSNLADAMIGGGAFCPFQEVHLSWQQQRGLWTDDGLVKPFAADRRGTLPGEGSALLLLEERGAAEARGAAIVGTVLGWSQRFSAPGEDDVEVRADALRAALPDGEPDWIAPSGLGHPELDRLEALAWREAFGALPNAGAVTVVDRVGFTGPASGPLNLVAALMAAQGADVARSAVIGDADTRDLAAALGRSGRTGAGAVVVGSCFSLDGVHAALAVRLEA